MKGRFPHYGAGVKAAVKHFWSVRDRQSKKQASRGKLDQGTRGAVTGGAQMDGFVDLISQVLVEAGLRSEHIQTKALEIPGFFRATKEWDLLAIREGRLIAAIEVKSQVGSFGNNFNNRTEEAMGSALDLWTAFREGAYGIQSRPWLGYLFLLEESPRSLTPVKYKEPHFPVFPEFREASYARRMELFCRKLVLERHYHAACLLLSNRAEAKRGGYREPAIDLAFQPFAAALFAHVAAQIEN